MFDFEKLDVYQKAKDINSQVYKYIRLTERLIPQQKTSYDLHP